MISQSKPESFTQYYYDYLLCLLTKKIEDQSGSPQTSRIPKTPRNVTVRIVIFKSVTFLFLICLRSWQTRCLSLHVVPQFTRISSPPLTNLVVTRNVLVISETRTPIRLGDEFPMVRLRSGWARCGWETVRLLLTQGQHRYVNISSKKVSIRTVTVLRYCSCTSRCCVQVTRTDTSLHRLVVEYVCFVRIHSNARATQICEHHRQKRICLQCPGNHICTHNKILYNCWLCNTR